MGKKRSISEHGQAELPPPPPLGTGVALESVRLGELPRFLGGVSLLQDGRPRAPGDPSSAGEELDLSFRDKNRLHYLTCPPPKKIQVIPICRFIGNHLWQQGEKYGAKAVKKSDQVKQTTGGSYFCYVCLSKRKALQN